MTAVLHPAVEHRTFASAARPVAAAVGNDMPFAQGGVEDRFVILHRKNVIAGAQGCFVGHGGRSTAAAQRRGRRLETTLLDELTFATIRLRNGLAISRLSLLTIEPFYSARATISDLADEICIQAA